MRIRSAVTLNPGQRQATATARSSGRPQPKTGAAASPASPAAATVPAGRLGHVDGIADVIKFPASDDARFMTGQIVAVNGGKTAA